MSNARFSILQAKAVKDKRISDSQFRTLAALGMYSDQEGWCYPSLQTLGEDLGKSKQAVGRDTIALRRLGYLEVTARFDKNGARRSCLYRLIFDTPRQRDVDTPSTPDVDTPSTPDVDVNVPDNDPMETLLSFERMSQTHQQWQGREIFAPQNYPLVDWYHKVTGQDCPRPKRKDWMKAVGMWAANNLTVNDLQAAYDMDIKWRGVFTSPNQLTDKAIALRAQRQSRPVEMVELL